MCNINIRIETGDSLYLFKRVTMADRPGTRVFDLFAVLEIQVSIIFIELATSRKGASQLWQTRWY